MRSIDAQVDDRPAHAGDPALVGSAEARLELECALGTAVKFSGDTERAQQLLVDVAVRADAAGNRRVASLARIEHVWPELASGQMTPDEALELAASARVVFEAESDEFGSRVRCTSGTLSTRYTKGGIRTSTPSSTGCAGATSAPGLRP